MKKTSSGIITDESDKREYRYFRLKNGLEVIIVQDEETKISGICMTIDTGSMFDPEDTPGVAHLLEHLLFIGTYSHPERDSFNDFIQENGGKTNAITAPDRTIYYFNINNDQLYEALKRFSEFFYEPLLDPKAIEDEIEIVDQENESYKQDDYKRIVNVLRETIDKTHPFSKFSTGSKKTLYIPDIYEKVVDFYYNFYYGENMKLCVVTAYDLDTVEEWISSFFSSVRSLQDEQIVESRYKTRQQTKFQTKQQTKIQNKPVKTNRTLDTILDYNIINKKLKDLKNNNHVDLKIFEQNPIASNTTVFIKPLEDISMILFVWYLPECCTHFKEKPVEYLLYMLTNNGQGSLMSSYLTDYGLDDIENFSIPTKYFTLLVINFHLTQYTEHYNKIISNYLYYIELIRERGISENVFNDMKIVNMNMFLIREREDSLTYSRYISENMLLYPKDYVIIAPYLYERYDPDLIKYFLDFIRPEYLQVIVVGKDIDLMNKKNFSIEKYLGAKYVIEKTDFQDYLDSLTEYDKEELDMILVVPPKPNPFFTYELKLKEREEPTKYPFVIYSDSNIKIWYKQDNTFLKPLAYYFFDIRSYVISESLESLILTNLLVKTVNFLLQEYRRDIEGVGIDFEILVQNYDITVKVGGSSEKQDIIIKAIFDRLMYYKKDSFRKAYKKAIDIMIKDLNSFYDLQPYEQAIQYLTMITEVQNQISSIETLIMMIESLQNNFKRFKCFMSRFLSTASIEGLIIGNVTKKESIKLSEYISSKFKVNNKYYFLDTLHNEKRVIKIPVGTSIFQVKNLLCGTFCVLNYYQVGLETIENQVFSELLASTIESGFYSHFRIENVISYITITYPASIMGILGFVFIVQSGIKDPVSLDREIENFLFNLRDEIYNMTDRQFEKKVVNKIEEKTGKDRSLYNEAKRYWRELEDPYTNTFDISAKKVSFMRTIKKQDLIDFFDKYLNPESNERRKLSIRILNKDEQEVKQDDIEDNKKQKVQLFYNMILFKRSCELYPVLCYRLKKCSKEYGLKESMKDKSKTVRSFTIFKDM